MMNERNRDHSWQQLLHSPISRRSILKRATAMTLATPALAGLLAACEDVDDGDDAVTDTADDAPEDPAAAEDPDDVADDTEDPDDVDDDTEDPDDVDDDTAEDPDDPDEVDDDAVEEPDGEPQYGGSVVLARPNDHVNMWPSFATGPTAGHCFDTVTRLVHDGEGWEIAPMLAESWEVDDTHIIYHLREDVDFHDGTHFDAEALRWNIEIKRTHPASAVTALLEDVDEDNPAEVVDEYITRVNLTQPSTGPLLFGMSYGYQVYPSSPAAFEEVQAEEDEDTGSMILRESVGTGPFVFQEWVTGSHITVTRNENYWDTDSNGNQLPYLDEIRDVWITEDSARLVEMLSGAADLTTAIPGRDVPRVQDHPEVQYIEDPASTGLLSRYFLNGVNGPFANDWHLRHAVGFAIDREAMAETIGAGVGYPGTGIIVPGVFGFDERVPYHDFDLDRAREHREQSDAPSGQEVRFVVIAREVDLQQAQMVQQFLQEIDLNVVIESLERIAWVEQVRQNSDYHMATQRANLRIDDTASWVSLYAQDIVAGYTRAEAHEPEIWEFMHEARAIVDDAERHEAYVELQTMMYEAAWVGSFWAQPVNFLINKRIRGFPTTWDDAEYGTRAIWVDDNQ